MFGIILCYISDLEQRKSVNMCPVGDITECAMPNENYFLSNSESMFRSKI